MNTHPLFIAGCDAINRALPVDNTNKDSLVRKWRNFCQWAVKQDHTEMKCVTREVVILYGQHLKSQFMAGEYVSTSVPKSRLYAVNRVMKYLTNGTWEPVRPLRDCGLDHQSTIPDKKPVLTDGGIPDVNSLVSYLLELQKSLGLPIREACGLDLKAALKEGRKTGF
ncbi:MAG: hypothetical protein ACXWTY_09545, partial [Methylobacter sp.]